MTPEPFPCIAVIGFGEAGSILGADLAATGRSVVTYDVLLDSAPGRHAMLAKARQSGVQVAGDLMTAIAAADLIISAVTPGSAGDVAQHAARALRAGQVFLDINSLSPAAKRLNSQRVTVSGATFVEAAVMAPVAPQRLGVPMLLGGAEAGQVAAKLCDLGMNATALSGQVGVAAAVKMCRSIVIKGIEALTVEALFAARRFGAEESVLASLDSTFPQMGWLGSLPDYLVGRVAEHGRRRAAELREVAATLEAVHLQPTLALATAVRQEWLVEAMRDQDLTYPREQNFSWRALADALKESK